MLDLKDTAVIVYKAAIYVTWDGFGEVNERTLFCKCNASLNMSHIIVALNCSF